MNQIVRNNRIRQHVPGFIEGVEPESAEFADLASLLEIPWVAVYAKSRGFRRFSVDKNRLMAEYQNGRLWYVVGYLKEPVEGLPVWRKDGRTEEWARE